MTNLPALTTALLTAGAVILAFVTGTAVGSSDSGAALNNHSVVSSQGPDEQHTAVVHLRAFPKPDATWARVLTDKKEIENIVTFGLRGEDVPAQFLKLSAGADTLSYSNGCNSGVATVTSIDDHGAIHLADASLTEKFCGPIAAGNENTFHALLLNKPIVIAQILPSAGGNKQGDDGDKPADGESRFIVGDGVTGIVFTQNRTAFKEQ